MEPIKLISLTDIAPLVSIIFVIATAISILLYDLFTDHSDEGDTLPAFSINSMHMTIAEGATDVVSVGSVAELLMTRYIYAFEATSIMLLIAVIGSMVLAKDSVTRASVQSREGN